MIKFCVKFVFSDGSELVSGNVYDSLKEANRHGESMMKFSAWNTIDCKVDYFVVGTCEFVF